MDLRMSELWTWEGGITGLDAGLDSLSGYLDLWESGPYGWMGGWVGWVDRTEVHN